MTSAARRRAQQYLRETSGQAVEVVNEAESCVVEHPESAVWTSFLTGLLLGAIAGWYAAERHERSWYGELGSYADDLRRKLRL